jgi:hypothetical protein
MICESPYIPIGLVFVAVMLVAAAVDIYFSNEEDGKDC